MQLNIVIFRYAREFSRELKQKKFIGLMKPSLIDHQILLTTNLKARNYTELPFHEYVHHLVKLRIDQPIDRWLEEGIAQYLATMRINNGKVEIGQVSRRQIRTSLNAARDLPWSEILSVNLSHEQTPVLTLKYDIALALIHYLVHGSFESDIKPTDRIATLVNGVSEGANAFGRFLELVGLPKVELWRALKEHFAKKHEQLTYQISPPKLRVEFRDCLDDVDRHILIARSLLSFNLERAKDILHRIDRQYPGDFQVLALLSEVYRQEVQIGLNYAQSAYRTKPDSLVTNLALANALVRSCTEKSSASCNDLLKKAETHYREVLNHDHKRVDAAFGLGSIYLHRGRTGEALNFLRVTQKQTPWSPRVNLQLGETYRRLGNFRKAKQYLTIAAEWDENSERQSVALKLLGQVKQLLND